MQRLRMASAGMLLVSLMCRMAYSVCPARRHVMEKRKWDRTDEGGSGGE